jgi:predicted SAM-dependent methyltransferase
MTCQASKKISTRFTRIAESLIPAAFLPLYLKLKRGIWFLPAMRQLAGHTMLHLGCGSHNLAGWANVDYLGIEGVIKWDITWPLPVKSDVIKFVYCEHLIEHITRDQAKALMTESYRVLSRDGVLRISTPSLQALVEKYLAGKTGEWEDVGWTPSTPCKMMNEGMRLWGHQFMYDTAELETLLRECGFRQITYATWRQSNHVELNGLECRPFHEEIIVEATK